MMVLSFLGFWPIGISFAWSSINRSFEISTIPTICLHKYFFKYTRHVHRAEISQLLLLECSYITNKMYYTARTQCWFQIYSYKKVRANFTKTLFNKTISRIFKKIGDKIDEYIWIRSFCFLFNKQIEWLKSKSK
jgi:hypothetical protein